MAWMSRVTFLGVFALTYFAHVILLLLQPIVGKLTLTAIER